MMQDKAVPASWTPEECLLVRRSGELVRFYLSRIDLDLAQEVTLNSGYVRRRWRGGYVHHLVGVRLFGVIPDGYTVDHIDRNRLNNVRSNLRLASWRGQGLNRMHGSKGYHRRATAWRAYAQTPEGRQYLGNFTTEREAQECADAFYTHMLLIAEHDGTYLYPVIPEECLA